MVWLPVAAAALVLVAVTVWSVMDRRALRRRGRLPDQARLGGLMAPLDEVFHPNAHDAAEIREAEQELPAPAPSPGDQPSAPDALILRLPRAVR